MRDLSSKEVVNLLIFKMELERELIVTQRWGGYMPETVENEVWILDQVIKWLHIRRTAKAVGVEDD